jgi:hypothetical protein
LLFSPPSHSLEQLIGHLPQATGVWRQIILLDIAKNERPFQPPTLAALQVPGARRRRCNDSLERHSVSYRQKDTDVNPLSLRQRYIVGIPRRRQPRNKCNCFVRDLVLDTRGVLATILDRWLLIASEAPQKQS